MGVSEQDVKPPPLVKTALTWGFFMGVSSNLRYQVKHISYPAVPVPLFPLWYFCLVYMWGRIIRCSHVPTLTASPHLGGKNGRSARTGVV